MGSIDCARLRFRAVLIGGLFAPLDTGHIARPARGRRSSNSNSYWDIAPLLDALANILQERIFFGLAANSQFAVDRFANQRFRAFARAPAIVVHTREIADVGSSSSSTESALPRCLNVVSNSESACRFWPTSEYARPSSMADPRVSEVCLLL